MSTEIVKTNTVISFNFNNHAIRTAGTPDAPLFCASDVCLALGYADAAQACGKLDTDEQELIRIEYGSGSKHALFVTESGLYSLILTSRKPEAKEFKRWVTSEVLPSIRKTGQYSVKPMSALDLLEAQCRALREVEARQLAQETALESVSATVSTLVASDVRRRELEEDALIELRQLPAPSVEAPGKTQRALINERVRLYAVQNGGGKAYPEAWSKLYRELYSQCHFDAKARAKNSGRDRLDEVERAGLLEYMYAISADVLIG